MFAVIETGGKQYKVSPGQTVQVEKLDLAPGTQVELDRVLLVADGDNMKVGQPTVEGAKVLATVLGHDKGRKVVIFKYRPRKRYRRKKGHRQWYTELRIDDIVVEGES